MICAKPKCDKPLPPQHWTCRCKKAYCSEACFVAAWHAVHMRECLHASDIKKEMAESAGGVQAVLKKGTKLLVSTALTKVCLDRATLDLMGQEAEATRAVEASRERAADEALAKEFRELQRQCSELREQLAGSEAAKIKACKEAEDAMRNQEQSLRECARLEKQLASSQQGGGAGEGSDVRSLQSEVDKLQEDNMDKWRDLQWERAHNNDLKDELTDAKKSLRDCEEQARRAKERAQTTEEELKTQSEVLQGQQLLHKLAEAQSGMQEFEREAERVQGCLESVEESEQEAFRLAHKRHEALEDDAARLTDELAAMTSAESDARADAERHELRGRELERDCDGLRQDLESARESCSETSRNLEAAEQAESDAQRRAERQQESAEEDRERLQRALADVQAAGGAAESELEQARGRVAALEDSCKQLQESSLGAAELQGHAASERARADELRQQRDESEQQCQDVYKHFETKCQELRASLASAEEAEGCSRKDVAERGHQLRREAEQVEALEEQLRDVHGQHCELKGTLEAAQLGSSELRSEFECLQEEELRASRHAAEVGHRWQQESEQLRELQGRLDKASGDHHDSRIAVEESQSQCLSLQSQCERLRDEEGCAQRRAAELERHLDEQRGRVQGLQRELSEASEAQLESEAEAQRGRSDAARLEACLDAAQESLRSHEAAAERQLREECSLQQALQDRNRELAASVAALEDAGEQLRQNIRAREHRFSEESEQASRELLGLQQELRDVTDDRARAEALIEQERGKSQELLSTSEHLREELDSSREALGGATSEIAEAGRSNEQLQERLRESHGLHGQLEEVRVHVEKEKLENQRWRTIIIEEQERNRDLQDQLTDANRERHQARRDEAAKKRECDRLQRQLDAAKTDGGLANDRLPSAKRRAEAKQDDHAQSEGSSAEASALRQECQRLEAELSRASDSAAELRLRQEQEQQAAAHAASGAAEPADGPFRSELEHLQCQLAEERGAAGRAEGAAQGLGEQLEHLRRQLEEQRRLAEAEKESAQEAHRECEQLQSRAEHAAEAQEPPSATRQDAAEEAMEHRPSTASGGYSSGGYNWWWKRG